MIFVQLLNLAPRHEFEQLAEAHKSECRVCRLTQRSQFVVMGIARALQPTKGSIVAVDRAHMGFDWISSLIPQGVFPVTQPQEADHAVPC